MHFFCYNINMLKTPFYDPKKTYEDNYKNGPFGAFAEKMSRDILYTEESKFDFLDLRAKEGDSLKGEVFCGMIKSTHWSADHTEEDFLNDWVSATRLMKEAKVQMIEANFSCPNEGDEVKRLLCFDVERSFRIAEAVKEEIGSIPLIIKLSYFEEETELREVVQRLGRIVDGFSTADTTKLDGLDMVKRLKKLREKMRYQFAIIGVGGVTTRDDFFEYQKAGVDVVMSSTGARWNPHLAQEIKEKLKN